MKPRCDCLNFCGDDPHIDKGLVRPCSTFQAEVAARILRDSAPALLASCKELLACADPNLDMAEIRKANAAIRKAEGK